MKVAPILSALLLIGCTTWYKPGATPHDFDVAKAACTSQSYQSAPINTVPMTVGSGYQQPMYTTCTGTYASTNCVTTGGNYVPPAVVPIDVNTRPRNAAFESCMFAQGWSKQKPAEDGAEAPQNDHGTNVYELERQCQAAIEAGRPAPGQPCMKLKRMGLGPFAGQQ